MIFQQTRHILKAVGSFLRGPVEELEERSRAAECFAGSTLGMEFGVNQQHPAELTTWRDTESRWNKTDQEWRKCVEDFLAVYDDPRGTFAFVGNHEPEFTEQLPR